MNHADKRRHGTHLFGERHNMAKLTEGMVREMRAKRECGATINELAAG